MNNNFEGKFEGKKLLVLAGAGVHLKVVKAAKEMGVYTIVTDYNKTEDSPAKQIADEAWELNITDVYAIVERCKKEKVDGVLNFCIDPAQKPYQQICEKLGLPCIGTEEQFDILTDKRRFKDYCIAHDVDVIPDYSYDDVVNDRAEYPLFIKPTNSRGSRGQAVCYNKEEALKAIEFASSESSDNGFICEKYMQDYQEMQVTYFLIEGVPYLIRTVDSYCGPSDLNLQKVVSCSVSPSIHTDEFLLKSNDRISEMIKSLGLRNGPVFMQGFLDDGVLRVFDPGLRFPGVDYELIFDKVFNIDFSKLMICFALTGSCGQDICLDTEYVWLNHNRAAVLFPNISAGTIKTISGIDKIVDNFCTVAFSQRYRIGDTIGWNYNVNQRFAEIDILCNSTEKLKEVIDEIQYNLAVLDTSENNMIYNLFKVSRIDN